MDAVKRAERNETIVKLVQEEKQSLQDVAAQFDLTSERVRQIVQAAGVDYKELRHQKALERREAKRREALEKKEQRRAEGRTANPRTSEPGSKLTTEELIAALDAYAQETGKVPTVGAWGSRKPSIMSFVRAFGSWHKAKVAAGFADEGKEYATGPQVRWTEERMLAALRNFLASEDARENEMYGMSHYTRWRKGNEGPSMSTLINNFGTWQKAKDAALASQNG